MKKKNNKEKKRIKK